MSTPARRHSPAVYRRRRIVALLLFALVVAAIVLAFWRPWEGAAESTGGTDAAGPSPSASGVLDCTAADVSVVAVTDKEAYGSDEIPQLSIRLTNTSSLPCRIDVGTAKQVFVVTSGVDTWWKSTDCQTESSEMPMQLAAGQTVSSATPLAWDRTRSAPDTCEAQRPGARPGYYNLAVSIGGIDSTAPTQFRLR